MIPRPRVRVMMLTEQTGARRTLATLGNVPIVPKLSPTSFHTTSKLLHFVVISLLLFSSLNPVSGCKCIPPSLERTYYSRSTVNYVRARVLRVIDAKTSFGTRRYVLRIQQNYKGCPPRKTITVRTRAQSAACGVFLKKGSPYVLPLRKGISQSIVLCDFISQFNKLTNAQKFFLNTRYVCCGKKCKCLPKVPLVRCFRQPCSPPETCNVNGAKCLDNYCEGCFAEWFDRKGLPVCL